jgi:hypothetical protein
MSQLESGIKPIVVDDSNDSWHMRENPFWRLYKLYSFDIYQQSVVDWFHMGPLGLFKRFINHLHDNVLKIGKPRKILSNPPLKNPTTSYLGTIRARSPMVGWIRSTKKQEPSRSPHIHSQWCIACTNVQDFPLLGQIPRSPFQWGTCW